MNTDELVAALSSQPARPQHFGATTTILAARALAFLSVLIVSWLFSPGGIAPSSETAGHERMHLLKLIFAVGVVAAVLPAARDLAVPGRKLGWASFLAGAPFVVIIAFAANELAMLPAEEWARRAAESHWIHCLWQIPAFAFPALVILMLGVRRLAPVHLVRAGAHAGLLAGAIGGVGYALHNYDDASAFVATAYALAIAEVAVLGAAIGPRVLRWT